MDVMLKDVRLAFPALWKPEAYMNGEPAYKAQLLFPKDSEAHRAVVEAINAVVKEVWGSRAAAMLADMKAKRTLCLHDGEEKASVDGFEGMFFVSARNKSRPTVVGRDAKPVHEGDPGAPYGGCYVNAKISIYGQRDNGRVNASLMGVQFLRDGGNFKAGRVARPEEFEALPDDDDEDLIGAL